MISKVLLYQAPEQTAGDAAEDYVVAVVEAAGAILIQHAHIAVTEDHHGGVGGGALHGGIQAAGAKGRPAGGYQQAPVWQQHQLGLVAESVSRGIIQRPALSPIF